tara:strand:- start:7474 stop:8151 length:678 start_codon:yes stop_codon:yes gene_type:complete
MIHLLSSSAFIICNKVLAKKLGLKATILLSDLISKSEYFSSEAYKLNDGYFFNTQSNIEEDTTLTPYQQRGAIKKLKDNNILDTKLMGIPARLHYKINENQVMQFLDNREPTLLKPINNNKQIKTTNNTSIKSKALEEFEKVVLSFNYSSSICKDFISYWTEKNQSGIKMKFQMQKTFDIKRRLERWAKNEKTWSRPTLAKNNTIKNKLETFNRAKNIMDKINGI